MTGERIPPHVQIGGTYVLRNGCTAIAMEPWTYGTPPGGVFHGVKLLVVETGARVIVERSTGERFSQDTELDIIARLA